MSYPFDNSDFPYGIVHPLTPPFIESVRPESVTSDGLSGAGIYLVRLDVAVPMSIDTMAVMVGTNNTGNLDIGVYEQTVSGFSLIASSGSTAAGSTSTVQAIALTTVANLTPGTVYYFAAATSDAACKLGCAPGYDAIADVYDRSLLKADVFPLPASLTGPTAIGAMVWMIGYTA